MRSRRVNAFIKSWSTFSRRKYEGLRASSWAEKAEEKPKATGGSKTFNMEIRLRLLGGRVMTGWKKLPVKVAYFPSPHMSETGTVARRSWVRAIWYVWLWGESQNERTGRGVWPDGSAGPSTWVTGLGSVAAPGTQDRLDVWDGALLAGVAALIIPIDVASQSVL